MTEIDRDPSVINKMTLVYIIKRKLDIHPLRKGTGMQFPHIKMQNEYITNGMNI